MDDKAIAELIAIGASAAANCDTRLRYHARRAEELGRTREDRAPAVNIGLMVKQVPITGESLPVETSAGSEVFSGTLNESGRLEVRTAKVGADTTLAMRGQLYPVLAVIFQEAGCVTVVLGSTLTLWTRVPGVSIPTNARSAHTDAEAWAEAA